MILEYIGNQDLENLLCHQIFKENTTTIRLKWIQSIRIFRLLNRSSLVRVLCIDCILHNTFRYAFLSKDRLIYIMIKAYIEIQI